MPDRYEDALKEEMAAWQQLVGLAHHQREALLGRKVQQMEALREQLQTQLGIALSARRHSLDCCGDAPEVRQSPFHHQAEETLRRAHEAVRLNLQLLRDTCSYLQMLRTAIAAESVPAGYGRVGPTRPSASGKSRVA